MLTCTLLLGVCHYLPTPPPGVGTLFYTLTLWNLTIKCISCISGLTYFSIFSYLHGV